MTARADIRSSLERALGVTFGHFATNEPAKEGGSRGFGMSLTIADGRKISAGFKLAAWDSPSIDSAIERALAFWRKFPFQPAD